VDGSVVGKRGVHGGQPMTSHACIAWDDSGKAYTGGTNSKIYLWDGAGSRQATGTLGGHGKGFICSIIWKEGKLYSGGKDGFVVVTDTASGEVTSKVEFGSLIRAIDTFNGHMVVGTRDGNIWMCGDDGINLHKVMESHSDGEVWGLAVGTGNILVTTADDNQIKAWDVANKCCIGTGKISEEDRRVRCGASSLSKKPASKCARAVAINSSTGHVAVGCNDGTLTIRNSIQDLDGKVAENRDSHQWIEAMNFSPCGQYLAVGSHDNKIRVYNAEYNLHGTCDAHQSFITSVDWS
jgi:WD40 repeat protein